MFAFKVSFGCDYEIYQRFVFTDCGKAHAKAVSINNEKQSPEYERTILTCFDGNTGNAVFRAQYVNGGCTTWINPETGKSYQDYPDE